MAYESRSTPRILVAITNWGTKNDQYLSEVVREYRSMPFHVDIVVLSNISKAVAPGVELYVVDLKGKRPTSLPFPHKKIFADRLNDYDLFIYSEDDILITERNIRAFWRACAALPKGELPGFFRFERGPREQVNYPDVHGNWHWDWQSVRHRGELTVASFTNEHSACYALTRQHLQAAIASGGFLVEPHSGKYDQICSAGTDPYTQCGFQKVLCISRLDDFLVHHLSNKYVNSDLGVGEFELRSQVETLLQIERNGHCTSLLFPINSKLRDGRFAKDCYEPVQNQIISAIPSGIRSVLSVGCGLGTTEIALAEKGVRVVAVPVDPVIASGARARGVEIVEGDFATARQKLEGEQFDCLILLDVLHLVRKPGNTLSLFTPLLRDGGTAIVAVPRVLRLTTIFRILRGDQSFQELGNYDKTGVHFTSNQILRRWLEEAGMKMESVINFLPASTERIARPFQWALKPILETKMGVKKVVVAKKSQSSRNGTN